MKKTFILITLFVFGTQLSHARKPAVTEFSGVEPSPHYQVSPGAEHSFDFNNNSVANTRSQEQIVTPVFTIFTLIAFAGLPFLVWFGMMRLEKTNKTEQFATTSHEETSTVKSLEDYRQEDSETEEEEKIAS